MRVVALLFALSFPLLPAREAQAERGISLGPPSPWAVGFEGYGGLLLQATSGEDRPHAFGGGQLSVRSHYLQAGAFIEITDTGEASGLLEPTQEHFRTLGIFAGTWLPFTNWVDLDASVGLGSRLYRNPSPLYGPNGLHETTGALTFRLGVSDRSSESLFGLRAGAALVGSVDLERHDVTWYRRYHYLDGTPGVTTGTTPLGGVSIGVVVTTGFDLCACTGRVVK